MLGYVSGVNAGQQDSPDFLVDVDGPAILAWIDGYCPQPPLENLFTASNSLFYELMMRAALAGAKTK